MTAEKDQTYALYNLTQEQLAHTLMPVGSYHKEEIRRMAADIGLQVAHKPDSQEICFIPDHDHARFIEAYTGMQVPEGNFVDLEGNVLGRHKGISHYTIGQRKGLNLSMGHPVFVVEIRPETNEVVIGEGKDVFTNVLCCDKLNWMAIDGLHGEPMEVTAKIRYSHKGSPCTIREIGHNLVECGSMNRSGQLRRDRPWCSMRGIMWRAEVRFYEIADKKIWGCGPGRNHGRQFCADRLRQLCIKQ